jgi:uncharacterized membrane protein
MPEKKSVFNQKDVDEHRITAAISYLWIACLIPLLVSKSSPFVQHHAKQGLILFILSFLGWVPFFGWILSLALVIVSVLGIVKSLNGESWEIPFVHGWSHKIKL